MLYRCENEERDQSGGQRGCYDIPAYGKMVYGGLQGVVSVLADLKASGGDLGHPICNNLRAGCWLMGTFL